MCIEQAASVSKNLVERAKTEPMPDGTMTENDGFVDFIIYFFIHNSLPTSLSDSQFIISRVNQFSQNVPFFCSFIMSIEMQTQQFKNYIFPIRKKEWLWQMQLVSPTSYNIAQNILIRF